MWIFDTPKTYSEMVEKISKSVFILSLFVLYILSCANNDFCMFLESISFGASYEAFGIKLNLALFYLPLLIGIGEHIFKIHDLISSLFGIRDHYDREIIVKEFLKRTNSKRNLKELSKKKIASIMSKTFYKYVSSTNPIIDSHSIILTLNEWCWFWIVLDSMLIMFLVGIVFLFVKWSWANALLFLGLLVCLLILLLLIMRRTIKYTKQEIAAIWNDEKRKEEISNALQDC